MNNNNNNDPDAAEKQEVSKAEIPVISEGSPASNEEPETNREVGLSNETLVETKGKSPVSARKAEANRRNATKSTGPKTARGKKTVSKNALKLGFFAKGLLVPHADAKEDRAEYDALFAEVAEHYQPAGWHEKFLVEQIVSLCWRLRRSLRVEGGLIAKALAEHRYQSTQSIADDLGDEESTPSSVSEVASLTDHLFLLSKEDLDGVLRHQAMIHRQLNHVIAEIERVQAPKKRRKIPINF